MLWLPLGRRANSSTESCSLLPRSQKPQALEIHRLLLFLLGRQPSDRALSELSERPLGLSSSLILLGMEFETIIRRGPLAGERLPHHRYDYAPTADELDWISTLLQVSADSQAALATTQDWLGLLTILVRDPGTLRQVRTDLPNHPRLDAFENLHREVKAAYPELASAAARMARSPFFTWNGVARPPST